MKKCVTCSGNYDDDGYEFDVCPKCRIKQKSIGLEKLHTAFKKWMWIEDMDRIDIVLAAALTRTLPYGEPPIWLIVVGASGDGKSEIINTLACNSDAVTCDRITSRTLISGYVAHDGSTFDFAPQLNKKIWLIPDFAQLLKLPPLEKGEVWGQLRNLYDGKLSASSGTRGKVEYDHLRVTLIGGATPTIQQQFLIFQDLGTRELIWRNDTMQRPDKRFNMMDSHYGREAKMKEELSNSMGAFLRGKKVKVSRKGIPKSTITLLRRWAQTLAVLRATADVDWYSGELSAPVVKEEPTRVYKQLCIIYRALRSLSSNYTDTHARRVISKLVLSNCNPMRMSLMNIMKGATDEFSIPSLVSMMNKGRRTILAECMALRELGIIEGRSEEQMGRTSYYFHPTSRLSAMLEDIKLQKPKKSKRMTEVNKNGAS